MANSASIALRRFGFFKKEEVAKSLPEMLTDADPPPTLAPDGAAYLAPRTVPPFADSVVQDGLLFFGDTAGRVHITRQDAQPLGAFRAFGGDVCVLQIATSVRRGAPPPLVVAIGHERALGSGDAAQPRKKPQSEVKEAYQYTIKLWTVQSVVDAVLSVSSSAGDAAAADGEASPNMLLLAEPTPLRTLSLYAGSTGSALSAFAATSDASQIVAGFRSGLLVLFRGNLANPAARIKPPTSIPVAEVAEAALSQSQSPGAGRVPTNAPVTTVTFGDTSTGRAALSAHDGQNVRLFATTDAAFARPGLADDRSAGLGDTTSGLLVAFDTTGPAGGTVQAHMTIVLDDRGCAPHCADFSQAEAQLMVGRDDGVYFFTSEDRGGAAAFEGRKQTLRALNEYIVVASHHDKSHRTELNVYDLQNKFVAFNHRLSPGHHVAAILTGKGTGTAFVLTSANSLLRLDEKDTQAKLEVLFKMNYYTNAIMLAKNANLSDAEVNNIYRMYGDHKYKKCDWDGAIAQYSQTIGFTEPSYVIRRFLDAQRIQNLTTYLEKLHTVDDGEHATKDHTTLLLNCYTKLKDVEKLNQFIAGTNGRVNFDVDTAIKVLKQAGYADHALELARQHGDHEWYMRIQLERPQPNFSDALDYMGHLPISMVEDLLKRYGKALVTNLSERTTGLLMNLCTGRFQETGKGGAGSSAGLSGAPTSDRKCRPEDFIHLYVDHHTWLRLFLEHVLREEGSVSPLVANTLLELLLRDWAEVKHLTRKTRGDPAGGSSSNLQGLASASTASVDPLSAQVVQDPLAAPSASEPHNATANSTTTGAGTGAGSDTGGGSLRRTDGRQDVELQSKLKLKEDEVMSLLRNERAPYDRYHALVLVQVTDFKLGRHYLYEKLAKDSSAADLGGVVTELLIDHHLDRGNFAPIMRVLRRESKTSGRPNPELWTKVLTHMVARCSMLSDPDEPGAGQPSDEAGGARVSLCEDESALEEAQEELAELLAEIDQDKILPAFQVVSILCSNPKLPLSVARDFVANFMREAQQAITDREEQIVSLRSSTSNMSARIGELGPPGSTAATPAPTPTARFAGADADSHSLKPTLGEAYKWEEMKRSMSKGASEDEANIRELEQSSDGFSTIAKFFGQGLIR